MAEKPKSLDDVDPKLLETYKKLGIPLKEQMALAGIEATDAPERKVAVDAVFDSVSVGTTFREELKKAGVIFLLHLGSDPRVSGTGAEVPGVCGTAVRQLLCDAEHGRLFGRVVRLCPAGRALSDGVVDVFPDQRREHRSVRTDADHR